MKRKFASSIGLLALMIIPVFLQACGGADTKFEVVSLDIVPPKVTVGQKLIVRAEVRNNDSKLGTYNMPLMVNGVADSRKTVMLPPGATEIIEFPLVKHKAGLYEISIWERNSTLEVQEVIPPAFELSELEMNPAEADIAEKIVISVKIANTGGSQGSYTAELKIDGLTNQTEKIIMAAGTESMLVFKVCADFSGTYEVAIGELTGEFVVVEPIRPAQPNTPYIPPASPSRRPPRC